MRLRRLRIAESEEIVLPSSALRSARDTCHAPGCTFITGLPVLSGACKHFKENGHGNAKLNAIDAKFEVSSPNFFVPA